MCVSDFDPIDEAQLFSLKGPAGPDQGRVGLGLLLLPLLHPAGGLPAEGGRGGGVTQVTPLSLPLIGRQPDSPADHLQVSDPDFV